MATVDRVLPWRRHSVATAEELAPVVAAYKSRHSRASTALLSKAYEVAQAAHRGQMRTSGEAYINHPLAVAKIVAEIGLDDTTIAAALLHDAVEDSDLTINEVRLTFGDDIAAIVDGVTKIDRLHFDSKEAQQAATMRKMLVAVAKDLRVLVIKLADRLHNMRTLGGTPLDKQRRVAQETLGIYAPLAHRLGMQEVRQQLEDLSFASLYPKQFAELDHLIATRSPGREVYLAKVVADVRQRLAEIKLDSDVTGRGKHLWSIYEKMVQKAREFDEIFDVVAVRVIVATDKDCYAAIGSIHRAWMPIPGRFKDYIAMPKFNFYQSLHTTVIGPEGKVVEFQIRTPEMHRRAEWGVASHWSYKDGEGAGLDWLNRIIDWQAELNDPAQFMESLTRDLAQDELFVLTPKGDVVSLPAGATPVDFAYAVHSQVGHTCVGARVNNRLVPLSHQLSSGDTCEIITSKVMPSGPRSEWLEFVATPKARNKIRQFFSRERRDDSIESGRDLLTEAFATEGIAADEAFASDEMALEIAEGNYADLDAVLRAVGDQHLSARTIAHRIARAADAQRPAHAGAEPEAGDIRVNGVDGVIVRLARCCRPQHGDRIDGFLRGTREVTVHRSDCTNALAAGVERAARSVDVEWDLNAGDREAFLVGVEVISLDRPGLLRDVTIALSVGYVNIMSSSTKTEAGAARMHFQFEIASPDHLDVTVRTLRAIDGVYDVKLDTPGE